MKPVSVFVRFSKQCWDINIVTQHWQMVICVITYRSKNLCFYKENTVPCGILGRGVPLDAAELSYVIAISISS